MFITSALTYLLTKFQNIKKNIKAKYYEHYKFKQIEPWLFVEFLGALLDTKVCMFHFTVHQNSSVFPSHAFIIKSIREHKTIS